MSINRNIKTEAIAGAALLITGERPEVIRHANYNQINFTPAQVNLLTDKLQEWYSAEPGEIRINVKPILIPWALKNFWLPLAGAAAAGGILGYLLRGR